MTYGFFKGVPASAQEIQEWRNQLHKKTKCLKCRGTGKLDNQRTLFGAWIITCHVCYGEGKH